MENDKLTYGCKLIKLLLLLFISGSLLIAQEVKSKEAVKAFARIEEGINTSSVDKFSNYLSTKSYISLSKGPTGYFSEDQTFYILKDYLYHFSPYGFKFSTIVTDSDSPFAAGTLKYINKGIRGVALVYVSLQLVNNSWTISQITIK